MIDIITGLMFIIALAFACSVLVIGYPASILGVALWLYRHGMRQERLRERTQRQLGEAWIREIERQ